MTNPKDPRSELERKINKILPVFKYRGNEYEPGKRILTEIMQAVDSYVGERERLAKESANEDYHH